MVMKKIKLLIVKFFNLLGFDVVFHIAKKGKLLPVLLDKLIWEPYYVIDDKMSLYFEGLKKSKMEWSDNVYKQLRFYSLQEMVSYALHKKLEGDFVECGVWKGHSAYIISKMLFKNGFTGSLHIFDSFEGGLSNKVGKDENTRTQLSEDKIKKEAESFSSTEEEVKNCLSDFNFVKLYKGWIPDRFKEVDNKTFSLVHIDVDLYEPTRDSLNFFYPRLVDGGVIVCDDYGLSQFPGAKKAIEEFLSKNDYKLFYAVPMGACFIIK